MNRSIFALTISLLGISFGDGVSAAGLTPGAVNELKQTIVMEQLPNCLDVTSYFDQVYCAGKVDALLDDVLNAIYKKKRQSLSSSERNQLKLVQRRWVEARSLECAWLKGDSIIQDLGCSTHRTVESIWFLENIESGSTFGLDIAAYETYVLSIAK